jgi:hypothetical protein
MNVSCKACVAVLFVLCSAAAAEDKYPPLTGQRNDNHGNIEWSSAVDFQDPWFRYSRKVQNFSESFICRVNWDTVKWKSAIPPKDSVTWDVVVKDEPRQVDGEIRYNGGVGAGEKSTTAPAWVPNDRKVSNCRSTGRVFVLVGDTIFPVDVTAISEIENGEVSYKLSLSAGKTAGRVPAGFEESHDLNRLLENVTVEWSSIKSELWEGVKQDAFKGGTFGRDGAVNFAKADPSSRIRSVSVKVPIREEPRTKFGTITFSAGRGDAKSVVCQVDAPALVLDGK